MQLNNEVGYETQSGINEYDTSMPTETIMDSPDIITSDVSGGSDDVVEGITKMYTKFSDIKEQLIQSHIKHNQEATNPVEPDVLQMRVNNDVSNLLHYRDMVTESILTNLDIGKVIQLRNNQQAEPELLKKALEEIAYRKPRQNDLGLVVPEDGTFTNVDEPFYDRGPWKLEDVDFNYIHSADAEGSIYSDATVPDPKNSNSGVTVAGKFDLGTQTKESLQQLVQDGLTKETADKLSIYVGKRKEEAKKFLKQNPLDLSKKEQEEITSAINKHYWKKFTDTVNPDVLNSFVDNRKQLTLLFANYMQYGKKMLNQNFFGQILNYTRDPEVEKELYKNLSNWGDKSKGVNNRWRKAAKYLKDN